MSPAGGNGVPSRRGATVGLTSPVGLDVPVRNPVGGAVANGCFETTEVGDARISPLGGSVANGDFVDPNGGGDGLYVGVDSDGGGDGAYETVGWVAGFPVGVVPTGVATPSGEAIKDLGVTTPVGVPLEIPVEVGVGLTAGEGDGGKADPRTLKPQGGISPTYGDSDGTNDGETIGGVGVAMNFEGCIPPTYGD